MSGFGYWPDSGWSVGRRIGLAALTAVQMLLAPPVGADTLRGVALVVGQSEYDSLPDLANTVRDAEAIESLLDDLGFDATVTSDRDGRRLSRDFDGLLDDAEGVDVALLYYAGHAVEIGGENFLVPVDTDGSAPGALAAGLVSLTELVADLRRKAKLTIVFLDACRTSPFPPGTVVRLAPDGPAMEVGAAGLGTRGAVSLAAQPAEGAEDLGAVIAFAAEPGKAALDGDPGGNSPYAAALLRHLSAMSGAEFGTVMRLVAEEVYLKTGGRQRPWTNESLRRLLYFGGSAPEPTGDEGELLKERRQLLLTIAALPDFERGQVERVAAQGGVPMDAVYGMLKALGQDIPTDPEALERLLREQTRELSNFLNERRAVENPDDELARLSRLSEMAVREGAIDTARKLRRRVDARIATLSAVIDRDEENIRQRRVEFAAELATSAEISTLAFDFQEAAEYYGRAYDQVRRWDDRLAFRYRLWEAESYGSLGDHKGDNDALDRALELARDAVVLAEAFGDPESVAASRAALGDALRLRGARAGDAAQLDQSAIAFRAALETTSRSTSPLAQLQFRLGNALSARGVITGDTAALVGAAAAFRSALLERTRETVPYDWSNTQNSLGLVLVELANRGNGESSYDEALAAYREALDAIDRNANPVLWATVKVNLGAALESSARSVPGTDVLEAAVAAYRDALGIFDRGRTPTRWAGTQHNLGNALAALGSRESDDVHLEQALSAFRHALLEYTRNEAPIEWALTMSNMGSALLQLGERHDDISRLSDAVAAFDAALQEATRERVPLDWVVAQHGLGAALYRRALLENDLDGMRLAASAFAKVLEGDFRERDPVGWASTQYSLGQALLKVGERARDVGALGNAITAFGNAASVISPREAPYDWANLHLAIGDALVGMAAAQNSAERLEAAVQVYRSSMEVVSKQDAPSLWAMGQDKLGAALILLGPQRGNKALVMEGRQAFVDAWDVDRERGHTQNDAYFRKRIAIADSLLDQMR